MGTGWESAAAVVIYLSCVCGVGLKFHGIEKGQASVRGKKANKRMHKLTHKMDYPSN